MEVCRGGLSTDCRGSKKPTEWDLGKSRPNGHVTWMSTTQQLLYNPNVSDMPSHSSTPVKYKKALSYVVPKWGDMP
jgi:hypothetical protein